MRRRKVMEEIARELKGINGNLGSISHVLSRIQATMPPAKPPKQRDKPASEVPVLGPGWSIKCYACNGAGKMKSPGGSGQWFWVACPICQGAGTTHP